MTSEDVMLGMVEGDCSRGKPARRCSSDIMDWCSYTLPESVHRALDRKRCRRIISLIDPREP